MSSAALPYHHGNLRNALIIAAAELIERDGTLDFSISEAAAIAGVSAAAPYRHFSDKDALLNAVRDLAFLGLSNAAVQTAKEHAAGSIEGILAMGHTYLQYARDKRVFFSLMWEARADIDERREKAQIEHHGFMILVELVSEFCRSYGTPETNTTQLATSLWSLSHGIAILEANQLLDMFDRTVTAESILDDSAKRILASVFASRPW